MSISFKFVGYLITYFVLLVQFCYNLFLNLGKKAKKPVANANDKTEEVVVKKRSKVRRKEQSVLQAKLTKLAIQIGYAGLFCFLNNFKFHWIIITSNS